MINNTVDTRKLDLSNVGKPQKGITNLNLVPSYVREKPKVAAPTTQAVQKPAAPLVKAPSSSAGSYQGVAINPGSDAGIAAQMRKIDAARASGPQNVPPVKGLFSDVKSSVSRAKAPETPTASAIPTYAGLVQQLAERANAGDKAVQLATKNLGRFQQETADKLADIQSDAIPLEFQQGRAQVVQQASQVKEAALQTAVANALAAQQQELGALEAAAGLAAPVQIAPGSTLAEPFAGGTVAGGLGGYANYQTAEQVMGLIRQYPDAGYVYDQTKTPQENLQTFQSTALQRSPTYQRETFGQPGATSVVGGAQLSSAAELTRQASDLQAATNGAEANFKLLVDTARRGGVNDTTVPALNRLQQNLNRGLTSSEAVATFRQLLEDVRMQYAVILGGGSVTDSARAQANAQIPDDVSLGALVALEQSMKAAATNRITGIQNQIQSLTGGGQSQGGGGSIWDF
jgi:hypothetical protein